MPRSRVTEEQKLMAVRSIKPGWQPMTQKNWEPRGTKPFAHRLRREVSRRARAKPELPTPRPSNWTWAKCVEWLETHEPPDDDVALPPSPRTKEKPPEPKRQKVEDRLEKMESDLERQQVESNWYTTMCAEYETLAAKLETSLPPFIRRMHTKRLNQLEVEITKFMSSGSPPPPSTAPYEDPEQKLAQEDY